MSFGFLGNSCAENPPALTITELTGDHITAEFTGEFFAFTPGSPCGGFTSIGSYTAQFSLPYIICQ